MKKLVILLLVCALALPMLLTAVPEASAAGVTLSFSKNTLRAGDTFQVTLNVALQNAITVNGSFSHSSNVSLTSIKQSTGTLDVNGKAIFVDLGSNPVSGTKSVAVATFQVSGSAKTGETVSVSFNGNYSNLDGDYPVSGSASVTVAAPLSTNSNLSTLTVGNATLTPAFDTNVTEYSAGEVEYSVSSLNIVAVPADGKATVSVSGNNLTVGYNRVLVVVKAENGDTKVYTITVTRKQDPNYVASGDNSLSGITVDGFLISPPFAQGVDSYVVWLPFETESIAVSATATDSKAAVSVTGGTGLIAGEDNTVVITCTAENGTKKEYYIIAKRAADPSGQTPEPTEPVDEPTEPSVPAETEPAPTEPITTQPKVKPQGLSIGIVAVLCVVFMVLGALIMFFIMKPKAKTGKDEEKDEEADL